MKNLSKNTIIYIVMLCIVLSSLALLIVDVTASLSFGIHPAVNFAFFLTVDFGALCLVLGFLNKSPWFFFLSSPLLSLSLTYILVCCELVWWLVLILAIFLFVIICLLSLIVAGNKTENIALNKSPEYKNYVDRKAEKEQAEAEEAKEELPEIKSFGK